MDNLCHILVGAAMGRAGLRRTTALGSATLMIAANLPDLDVLVFATDTPAIAFRRGWTHGVLAQALLPIALTGVMVAIGRYREASAHHHQDVASGFGRKEPAKVHAGWLLALSYLGIYSHVFLDYLNNYGIRLLTPFDWRWFYGDTLFIIDPWMWATVGLGVWLSRRWRSSTPARVALGVAVVYIGAMFVSARLARGIVIDAWRAEHGAAPRALMVGPQFVDPFRKNIIVDAGDHYVTGEFFWRSSPRVRFAPERVPKNDHRREVQAARGTPPFAAFLTWSRFPFYQTVDEADGTRVAVGDMRFSASNPLRDRLGRGRFSAEVVVRRGEE